MTDLPTALDTALDLLHRGLWPVPITAPDDPGPAAGKRPIGEGWGLRRHGEGSLRACYRDHPRAGVGLKLGRDGGVIDIEIEDRDTGENSLALLLGGEVPETMGWESARGGHLLFAWTDRLARYGRTVLKLAELPGLEIRIGSAEPDGKQLQSVCPPSPTSEGWPRRWNGCDRVAPVPESFFIALDPILLSAAPIEGPRPPLSPPRSAAAGDRYVAAALAREAGLVASAAEGNRNAQLNLSAFALGQLVGGGVLSALTVVEALTFAAGQAGLGDAETQATIRSGIAAGSKQPRTIPDPPSAGNKSQKSQKSQKPSSGGAFEISEIFETCSEIWESPVLESMGPADPFPLDLFPSPLADLIAAATDVLKAPPDYLAVAALGIVSGAIGRSYAIRLKDGWTESAALYLCLVGDPGMAKSPAIGLMSRPLWTISGELLAAHRRAKALDEEATAGPTRNVVDDATVEALAPILQDNPRGLIMVRDELSALFAGHNQYKAGGKGADRQFYLSCWSGAPVTVDRKNNPDRVPIHIPHPSLSIVGGLTPGMLSELSEGKGRDDGFLDRILFTLPTPVQVRWHEGGIPEDASRAWEQTVRWLFSRPLVREPDGRVRPYFLRFAADALPRFAAWFDAHCIETEGEDFPPHLKGPWAKFRAYCARLALVLELLTRAFDPEADAPVTVSAATVARAIRLTTYFKSHTRRVRLLLRGADQDNADARALLRWCRVSARGTFSERDARQNFRARFPTDGPELGEVLRWLQSRHCVRPVAVPISPKGGPGRPHSAVYEVNPALLGP